MVIDLHKCSGCGACGMACKAENNTMATINGKSYNWANFLTMTEGKFPNVNFRAMPTLCNHCSDAPCVEICPVNPKAMYKSENGVTLHNDDRCIGCQMCINACPYSSRDTVKDGVQYSVISYTDDNEHPQWKNKTAIIPDCTSTPAEVVTFAGALPPMMNEYTHPDYKNVRAGYITEKCIFCDHRTSQGLEPNCVVSCPSGARTFGDISDPDSEVSKLLKQYESFSLKDNTGAKLAKGEQGTRPNVYYIRDFGPDRTKPTKVEDNPITKESIISVSPNPAQHYAKINFELKSDANTTLTIYNTSGKKVIDILDNKFIGSGAHTYELNCNLLANGTYFCVLTSGAIKETVNLIVVK